MAGFTASPSSPTKSSQQSQGTTGSRLAYLYYYCNPKMLFRREFYATGLRGGALTFVAVLSVLALYSLVAAVSVVNVIKYIKGRKTTKSASLPRPPPGDYELADKAAGKPIVDELDMDNVQEIPGEMDFAALKDVMPAPDQIPEIDSDEDESSVDERGPAHHIMSDDDTTLVGQEDFAGVKGSPETQIRSIIPVLPLENKFERPISPPATPPTNPEVADITPDKFGLEEEPSKADAAIDKVTEMTVNIVEEAAKAVEEHKQVVEEVNKPAPATTEAGVDEPKLSEAPSDSEYVVVSNAHPESPITKEPTKLPEVAFVATVDSPLKALSTKLFDEPMSEPLVSEPASAQTAEPVVKEAKPEVAVAALVAEPEVVEAALKPVEAEEPKPVEVSHPIEAATMVEAPKEVEAPRAVNEPQQVEAPKVVEAPKLVETPAPAPKETSAPAPAISKSLGRPRVMRRATGSTAATASASTVAITSPLSSTVSTSTLDKSVTADKGFRRADDALNKLAGSILRSSPSERAPSRPASPSPSAIPRSGSPAPGVGGRSASPAYLRSDSPTSDAGTGGSRPASPALGMSRRGSIALANGAKPSVSRQSSLANVTNAPVRQPSALTNSSIPARPPSRQGTFSNIPRGGSSSPPPMPLPPARQGSLGRSASPPPQIPQAAVMSPSVLSRKATLDSNGSPGSPPAPAYRQSTPPPRSRTPAEEFSTTGATARRRVPFPSAQEVGHTPVPAANAVNNASPARPKPRPRTSTSNGSSNAPSAPNTLQASLLSNLTGSPKPPSPGASSNASNPASPVRRDSFVSAVSKRDSIFSVYEYSDMDMSVSDLDFPGSQGHRVGRLNSMSSIGSTDGEGDEGLSGNEEEKRKKRARRRSKAKAQQMKKQKRSKRN